MARALIEKGTKVIRLYDCPVIGTFDLKNGPTGFQVIPPGTEGVVEHVEDDFIAVRWDHIRNGDHPWEYPIADAKTKLAILPNQKLRGVTR